MASGYSQEWSERNSVWTATFRLYYSSSYDPATNTSTITVVPQFKCSANYGNDYRVFKSDVDNYGGVLGNGYYLYQLGGDPGYGNYLVCGSATNEFANLRPGSGSISTFKVSHNANGYATFDLGFYGSVRASYDNSYVYGIGGTQRSLSIYENAPYAISYSANGGSGEPASQSVYAGVSYTLSSVRPTRTGYTFLGWATSPSATTAAYQPGASVTPNGNLPLYAVWKINSYTVTCEDRVGSASGALLGAPTSYLDYGSAVSGASFGSDATYDAYYVGYHYTGSSPTITVDGDETVYRYFALNTWSVSYNANGHGTAPSSQTKTYGTALTLRSFISNQTGTGTRADYTITGNANGGTWSGSNGSASRTPQYTYSQNKWNTKSDGTGTGYASGASYTENAATTLYAIWNTSTSYTYTYTLPSGTPAKNQTVTVTFNANGGSTTKTSQTSTRAMTFSGWYTAATGGTKRTTASQVSASETVYAHYGDGTSVYPSVTLPTASQCTRTGYTLLGFATSATATSAAYSPGESYTPTAGITLYAVWRIISYGVSASISARGITANILRTASPVAGAASGLLSDGDTVYYNDTVKVSWAISTGYQADTLRVNGEDVSLLSEKTVTVASALTVILTVKLGAIVYINGVAYQAFIDNGSSFNTQYEAYIDNGSSWEAY